MKNKLLADHTEEFRAYIKILEDKHNRMMSGKQVIWYDTEEEG